MTTGSYKTNDDSGAEADIEKVAESAGRYARTLFDEASPVADHLQAFVAAIRKDPVQASVVALTVGVFAGMVIRRM